MEAAMAPAGSPLCWDLYFPGLSFSDKDPKVELFKELYDILVSAQGDGLISQVKLEENLYILPVDFQAMQKNLACPNLPPALQFAPADALLCFAAAVHEVLVSGHKDSQHQGKVCIRLHNYPESLLALKHLKAAYVGKLISVRGTVVRMSIVKPLVVEMHFTCAKCGHSFSKPLSDGCYCPPTSCGIYGCKSKTFQPNRTLAKTINFQKLRIQELSETHGHEEGRMPRTVECELRNDLVDVCIPGDVVTVCGLVKAINTDMDVGGGRHKTKGKSLFYLYIEAVSVVNSKNQGTIVGGDDDDSRAAAAPPNNRSFTLQDLEFIVKFATDHGRDMFRQILHSICPSIYGHELVKAGLTLALFGGVQKYVLDQNKVPVRGDIHVLIVGDPGLGKSQLLQAAASVSPRGIYVCGNATTTAGLTVAVVKDAITGDYIFEAGFVKEHLKVMQKLGRNIVYNSTEGAMVLADSGVCCIDEFDKMSTEHQALLEAMEQQSVSIAKAGLVASLSARTAVIAAANPVGGHYNRSRTVNENLKMSAALLSRFDLVFILLDKPDELMDQRLSEHIMALHAGSEERYIAAKQSLHRAANQSNGGKGSTLASRLKLNQQDHPEFSPLSSLLLRKYIAYAKQYVSPRMSDAAAKELGDFYLELRKHSHCADGTPITARQMESLVRLAEARARLELRDTITQQDAKDAVEIMKESLYDKLVDEHGVLDYGRSGGMSQQKETKRFLNALQRQSELQQKACFTLSELCCLADDIDLRVRDIDVFIETLNDAGYLLKKGARTYQVLMLVVALTFPCIGIIICWNSTWKPKKIKRLGMKICGSL